MSERIKMFLIHDLDQIESHLRFFLSHRISVKFSQSNLDKIVQKINRKSETQVLKSSSADRPVPSGGSSATPL
jgi:hypothetical protein